MKNYLVVFVCTGNICRSPMAEGILKDAILDEYESGKRIIPVEVMSSGTHTVNGRPASSHGVHVAKKQGINLQFHRSRMLTEAIIKTSDLILTMETAHKEYIQGLMPEAGHVHELKAFGRTEFAPNELFDVYDPIGQDMEMYQRIFNELREEIDRVKDVIFARALEKYRG